MDEYSCRLAKKSPAQLILAGPEAFRQKAKLYFRDD
jgi:hypothetical protein